MSETHKWFFPISNYLQMRDYGFLYSFWMAACPKVLSLQGSKFSRCARSQLVRCQIIWAICGLALMESSGHLVSDYAACG
jgi:hypothetical protein